MDIERLKYNREFEFYNRIWDDQSQIAMFYLEQPEFRITFWDYYFHQIFDQAEYHYLEWTDFTRDYHACDRTLNFGRYPIAIGDLDEYLNDLYSYKDERKLCYSEDDLCELRADLASEDRSTAVTATAKNKHLHKAGASVCQKTYIN